MLGHMKHIVASVTACIGATASHREKYVVCVTVQHKLPATLWYTYKLHGDFVQLFHDLVDLAAHTSCAQECSIGCALASLAGLLDPLATTKLDNLNAFVQKIAGMTRSSSEHADVCLLRAKVDAALKAFLEWREVDASGRGGLKRQLSLPSLLIAYNNQQPDCLVMNQPSKFGGSHSYPVKITKLDSTAVLPTAQTPLGVLRKFRVMEATSSTTTQSKFPSPTISATTCSNQLFQRKTMLNGGQPSAVRGMQGRRRVFTEVNFDGM
ncbi:hypothetical protein DYB37_002666 [Aphanomyces astaci]|uniref:Uncharacterized protein n=1 Tax=Aphanomyces astaci TaxID=112090 RepID=A0A397EZU7_APHAT|nr:hypothetical protein DYB31_000926 [Aphanomyces astaci]RHZ24907.1 hypothetical protein DYB37_002666 [Aphanomyces astaci]